MNAIKIPLSHIKRLAHAEGAAKTTAVQVSLLLLSKCIELESLSEDGAHVHATAKPPHAELTLAKATSSGTAQ